MQNEDTPSKVCLQLWMTEPQRQALRAQAAAKQTSMTQCILQALALAAPTQQITPRTSRRWKPKAHYVDIGADADQQAAVWVRSMEAARGRELPWPEWDRVHALFLGLKSMRDLKPSWSLMRERRAGRHVPTSPEEARLLQVLDDFDKLRKHHYELWDAETGHTASKRRKHRADNLEAVRAGDAARQRRKYAQTKAKLDQAKLEAFLEAHVTAYPEAAE